LPVATPHLHSISATTNFWHSLAFPKERELTTFLWKNLRVTFFPEITPNISSFISKNQEIPELINTAAMPCPALAPTRNSRRQNRNVFTI